MRLADKVVLITGAANGLGAATAKLCAKEGASGVVVCDVMDGPGNDVVADIENENGRAIFVHLDVTSEIEWIAAVEKTIETYGKIDVLVNNAGISGATDADQFELAAWNRLIGVHATGSFLGIKHSIPHMEKQGAGSIVNVSSIAGLVGHAGLHFGYNASKGAVRLLTKGVAAKYGRQGIRVNSVHPGLMPPMVSSISTVNPVRRAQLLEGVPLGRAGEAVDVANTIVYLASDDSAYVTGTELVVDGGFTCV